MRKTTTGLCRACFAISVSIAVTLLGAILSSKSSIGISQGFSTLNMSPRASSSVISSINLLPLAPPRRCVTSRNSEIPLRRRREVTTDAKKKTKVWGALRQATRASPSSKWIPRTEEMDFQVIGDSEKFTSDDVVNFIKDWFARYPDRYHQLSFPRK